jgi:putative choloylglycine hydrolase
MTRKYRGYDSLLSNLFSSNLFMEKTIVPSATQWTSATDMNNRIIYFRTMYNSTIRNIDLLLLIFSKCIIGLFQ